MIPRHVKYLMIIVFLLFILLILRSGISEDEEVAAYERHILELQARRVRAEQELKLHNDKSKNNPPQPPPLVKPIDYRVKFVSGREMIDQIDGEHRAIQMHTIQMENFESIDALVQCKDPFSKFSHIIPPGEKYEFTVTDLLSKRHYWCNVHFGKLTYRFAAYGEGAPRDNNFISLRKEGAFINEKSVVYKASD